MEEKSVPVEKNYSSVWRNNVSFQESKRTNKNYQGFLDHFVAPRKVQELQIPPVVA